MAKKNQVPMERYLCIAIIVAGSLGLYVQNEKIDDQAQKIHEQGTQIGNLQENMGGLVNYVNATLARR